jgi:hypothetical protein
MSLPVDFEEKAKAPPSPSRDGYPYRISASDLMKNFAYAAGEFKEEDFDVTESQGESSQYTTRKISLKNTLFGTDQGNIPFWNKNLNEGLGGWSMIFPDKQGQLFYWDQNLSEGLGGWQMIEAPTKPGEFLYWDVEANDNAGGWSLHDPAGEGTLVYFSEEDKKWKSFIPTGEGTLVYFSEEDKEWKGFIPADPCVIFFKDKEWQSLAIPDDDDPLQLTAVGGELSWTPGIPEPPESGTYVLGSVDGVMQWIETEECEE